MKQLDPIPNEIAEHCSQPEAVRQTINSLDVHDLSYVATKLAERLADGVILKWSGGKFLCGSHIEADLSENALIMYDLVSLTLEGAINDAQDYLTEKFNEQARERTVEMLEDMSEMPRGYYLEDYL